MGWQDVVHSFPLLVLSIELGINFQVKNVGSDPNVEDIIWKSRHTRIAIHTQ